MSNEVSSQVKLLALRTQVQPEQAQRLVDHVGLARARDVCKLAKKLGISLVRAFLLLITVDEEYAHRHNLNTPPVRLQDIINAAPGWIAIPCSHASDFGYPCRARATVELVDCYGKSAPLCARHADYWTPYAPGATRRPLVQD